MLRLGICVVLLLGSFLTAGCSGSSSERRPAPEAGGEPDESKRETLTIKGVVEDEEGRPQPRVSVCAYAPTSDTDVRGAPSATAMTDGEGRFVLTGLSPGRWRLGSPPEIATDLPFVDELVVEAGAENVSLVMRSAFQRR